MGSQRPSPAGFLLHRRRRRLRRAARCRGRKGRLPRRRQRRGIREQDKNFVLPLILVSKAERLITRFIDTSLLIMSLIRPDLPSDAAG
ncbi:hypothetical protein ACP4OV_002109 [Aristida adscensionis]